MVISGSRGVPQRRHVVLVSLETEQRKGEFSEQTRSKKVTVHAHIGPEVVASWLATARRCSRQRSSGPECVRMRVRNWSGSMHGIPIQPSGCSRGSQSSYKREQLVDGAVATANSPERRRRGKNRASSGRRGRRKASC